MRAKKLLQLLALAVAAIVVIWSFFLVGSPSYNRKLAADKNRVDDLVKLERVIERYFDDNKVLPPSLKALPKPSNSYYYSSYRLIDTVDKRPYEYEKVGRFRYKLCAVFSLPSSARLSAQVRAKQGNRASKWEHPEGRHCFNLEIPERLKRK